MFKTGLWLLNQCVIQICLRLSEDVGSHTLFVDIGSHTLSYPYGYQSVIHFDVTHFDVTHLDVTHFDVSHFDVTHFDSHYLNTKCDSQYLQKESDAYRCCNQLWSVRQSTLECEARHDFGV